MRPSRKPNHDQVKTLLRDKDEQIATLEKQLEAYSARASTAHARLLKTIDVLDSLRTQHALEMSFLAGEKMKLTHAVNRWRTVARTLEIERDEMKDVVEDLIEKIQISNEWNSWPCSRMHITKHAELHPLAFDRRNLDATIKRHDSDLLEYASSVIARLRTELVFERHQHCRTAEEANTRIEELEAKIAVREAELETCINASPQRTDHDNNCVNSRNIPKKAHLRPKPISDEECLRVLESNSARNKSLEMEIHDILAKLENARLAISLPNESDISPAARPSIGGPLLSDNSSKSGMNVEMREPKASSPAPTLTNTIPTLPIKNDEDTQQLSIGPLHSGLPSIMPTIAKLDNHIRSMSAQTDALKSERSILMTAAVRQKREISGMNVAHLGDVLPIEEECIRLSTEVQHLQQQIDRTRASAKVREEELLREIATLRSRVGQLSSPYNPEPFDTSMADENMELATPLQPTTILPLSGPATPPGPIDPSLFPLPFSPERTSSPPLLLPAILSSPAQRELERVQDALTTARDNLAKKDGALAQLRTDVEDLRRQMPRSSLPPGDQR
ncbi:hypothetical protein J3A83DRAFT_4376741 [Scleroderma citrinum]